MSVLPDGSKGLSEGVVVEASVLARVFRIKLLTLEGTVLLSPARVTDGTWVLPVESDATAADVEGPTERGAQPASTTQAGTAATVGSRLHLAEEMIDANSDVLEELDLDGVRGRRRP